MRIDQSGVGRSDLGGVVAPLSAAGLATSTYAVGSTVWMLLTTLTMRPDGIFRRRAKIDDIIGADHQQDYLGIGLC